MVVSRYEIGEDLEQDRVKFVLFQVFKRSCFVSYRGQWEDTLSAVDQAQSDGVVEVSGERRT